MIKNTLPGKSGNPENLKIQVISEKPPCSKDFTSNLRDIFA